MRAKHFHSKRIRRYPRFAFSVGCSLRSFLNSCRHRTYVGLRLWSRQRSWERTEMPLRGQQVPRKATLSYCIRVQFFSKTKTFRFNKEVIKWCFIYKHTTKGSLNALTSVGPKFWTLPYKFHDTLLIQHFPRNVANLSGCNIPRVTLLNVFNANAI